MPVCHFHTEVDVYPCEDADGVELNSIIKQENRS